MSKLSVFKTEIGLTKVKSDVELTVNRTKVILRKIGVEQPLLTYYVGPPGPIANIDNLASELIQDTQISPSKTYSSQKSETRLGDEVVTLTGDIGDVDGANFVVNFLNALSQGGS